MYFGSSYIKHKTLSFRVSNTLPWFTPGACLALLTRNWRECVTCIDTCRWLVKISLLSTIGSVWFLSLRSTFPPWRIAGPTSVTVVQVLSSWMSSVNGKMIIGKKKVSPIYFKSIKRNLAGGIRCSVNQDTSAECHLDTPSVWCFEPLDWPHRLTLRAKARLVLPTSEKSLFFCSCYRLFWCFGDWHESNCRSSVTVLIVSWCCS